MQRGRPRMAGEVTQGFAVSLGLWAALLIATEITVNAGGPEGFFQGSASRGR